MVTGNSQMGVVNELSSIPSCEDIHEHINTRHALNRRDTTLHAPIFQNSSFQNRPVTNTTKGNKVTNSQTAT